MIIGLAYGFGISSKTERSSTQRNYIAKRIVIIDKSGFGANFTFNGYMLELSPIIQIARSKVNIKFVR
jgi:hypothetical protein